MSDHEIAWTFEPDSLYGAVICHAEPGAPCRIVADPSECRCDPNLWEVECDRDGKFYHTTEDLLDDCIVRHNMVEVGAEHCAIKTSIDYDLVDASNESFEITGRTPIETWWESYALCMWRRA